MSTTLSRFLSVVLHPLLMPFYAMVLIFRFNTYLSYTISPVIQRVIFLLVFLSTCALPALTAVFLLQKGKIKTLQMETSTERNIPFITTAVYYAVCFYLLYQLPVPRLFSMIVLGAGISVFAAFFINLKWKISIHMIGMGGMAGIIFSFSQLFNVQLLFPLCGVIIIAGILGTARLNENAHTPSQIYSGFIFGFITEWVMLSTISY